MFRCGSAFEPGASGLPYYCASICVRSWYNWRASCVDSNPKKKKTFVEFTWRASCVYSKPQKQKIELGKLARWIQKPKKKYNSKAVQIAHGLPPPPSKTNTSYKAWGDAVWWLRMSRWVGAAKSSIRKIHLLNSSFLLITDVISVVYHFTAFVTIFVLFDILFLASHITIIGNYTTQLL